MTFRHTQPRACHHTYLKNRLDSLRGVSVITVHLQGAAAIFRVGRHKIIMDHYVKVGASHTPSQTHLPLTSRVATHSPLGAQPRSDRILRLPCGRLGPAAPYMYVLDALKSARAAAPACRQAGALEVRYRAAAGVGEEARGSTLPAAARVPVVETGVNVETWRHVTDPIVMGHMPLQSLDMAL
jgi:hypothetical protein